ncbi:MAG: hypothetical protein KDD01_04810 [Phaeodactylibacter sp.]|nr:hypothetical protein [Phaeodactylibacter sp.]MCB0612463.1 hypothetical protein [Phaeodactylibacter sp.]MCB9304583.1 hypothetical protein [Lewinellaceae bacterium]
MDSKIQEIYLSGEGQEDNGSDAHNTDVIVRLEDGSVYAASFFTYDDIERIRREHQRDGEFLNGKYFWAEQMVLVDSCSRADVTAVVEHMLETGDFLELFRRL